MSASNLAKHIVARRTAIGLTQVDVAERRGPAVATMRNIEHATCPSVRPSTLRRLDEVLGWPPGTGSRLLSGDLEAPEDVLPVQETLARKPFGVEASSGVAPKAVEYRSDPVLVRAADAAPRALGEFIGHAVALVLLNHQYDEHPDADVHELAHRVLVLASIGRGGGS